MIHNVRSSLIKCAIFTIGLLFPQLAFSESCETNPIYCTPAQLCEKTTETISGMRYWISDESNNYLKITKKYGLDCKAEYAASDCQKDANKCSIVELCEIATEAIGGTVSWSLRQPEHTKLAKSFGMDCGITAPSVPVANGKNPAKPQCDQNPAACVTEALCEKATYQLGKSAPQWKTGDFKTFVNEAKRRGLTCGVVTVTNKTTNTNKNYQTSYDKCDASLTTCTEIDLCTAATLGTENNKKWKVGAYIKYVNEAKRRGLSCGVKNSVLKDQKIQPEKVEAKSDLEVCTDQVGNRTTCNDAKLCSVATIVRNGSKNWVQRPIQLVNEAKRRGLTCGVISGSSGSVEQPKKSNTVEGKCSKIHDDFASIARNFFNQSNHKSWKMCLFNGLVFSDGSQIVMMWNGNIKYGKGKFGLFSSQIYCLDSVTRRVKRSSSNSCE